MNLRRSGKPLDVGADVKADVRRIERIWHGSLARSGGPFLFGEFSAVDAFFAPVVARFDAYVLSENSVTLQYMETVKAHPAWRAWAADAARETWIVPEDEV